MENQEQNFDCKENVLLAGINYEYFIIFYHPALQKYILKQLSYYHYHVFLASSTLLFRMVKYQKIANLILQVEFCCLSKTIFHPPTLGMIHSRGSCKVGVWCQEPTKQSCECECVPAKTTQGIGGNLSEDRNKLLVQVQGNCSL